MTLLVRSSLLLLIALALSACGYQLRGSEGTLSADYERLQIVNLDTTDPLYQALSRRLSDAGSAVVSSSERATAKLVFTRNDLVDRVAIVDARAQPREYELAQTVSFRVELSGDRGLPARSITASRQYGYDPLEVLGSAGNEQLARTELAENMARLVFYRLLAEPVPVAEE